ncbi:YraN family protein [Pseudoglutamicibacter cumminsii]|uniref:YraN family protein n=1 Tax=Pseudoglutamicibacter cumminsii TaxID=156979 RepID=UPI001959C1B7|nr:YraN family protein [Pseudoglutamicibacter cumminsii]MBM7796960.1 putative endonuclease [Pseudoglutamicibacter cumminsii]
MASRQADNHSAQDRAQLDSVQRDTTQLEIAQLRTELGRRGEEFAAGWCHENGIIVLDRNWRGSHGELDIVGYDPAAQQLVALEVKTRSGTGYGLPAEAVTLPKFERLQRLIWEYAQGREYVEAIGTAQGGTRVDVLGIVWPRKASAPASVEYYREVTGA